MKHLKNEIIKMSKDLILLHGALGSKDQLEALKSELGDDFNVHTFNFEGHGDRNSDSPLSIARFAENLKKYISENKLQQPNIFGYSMGGYVALFAEANNSGLLGKIVTLGTKFNWTPESSRKEVRMLNPEVIEEKVPRFAENLSRLHSPNDWKINMWKTADMMLEMGENPPLNDALFSRIRSEILLTLGDKDQMVSKEETNRVLEQLSNSSFLQFDDCEHPIEKVNLIELKKAITEFISE